MKSKADQLVKKRDTIITVSTTHKMLSFAYRAFGLEIKSEIEIPEFPISGKLDSLKDVTIKIDKIEKISSKNNRVIRKATFEKSRTEFYLEVPQIAKFKVSNGNQIVIELYKSVNENSARLFLLGTCFGILLQQRKMFCLHASGIVDSNGEATLFLGHSGAGKSTTCKYFTDKGFDFIGDDYLPVYMKENRYYVYPSYPQFKLWENSIDLLSVSKDDIHHRLRPEIDKFSLLDWSKFHDHPIPIANCFLLDWDKDENYFETQKLDLGMSIASFRYHTYRYRILLFEEEKKELFNHCLRLGKYVSLSNIRRGQSKNNLDKILGILRNQESL